MYKLRLSLPLGVSLVTKESFPSQELAVEAAAKLPQGFEAVLTCVIGKNAIYIPLKEKKHHGTKRRR